MAAPLLAGYRVEAGLNSDAPLASTVCYSLEAAIHFFHGVAYTQSANPLSLLSYYIRLYEVSRSGELTLLKSTTPEKRAATLALAQEHAKHSAEAALKHQA